MNVFHIYLPMTNFYLCNFTTTLWLSFPKSSRSQDGAVLAVRYHILLLQCLSSWTGGMASLHPYYK